MNKIYLIILLIFFSGCASSYNENKNSLFQKQQLEDFKTCKYYGFKEDTNDFSYCLMNLDNTRKKILLTKKMLECQNVRRDNSTIRGTGFWGGVLMGMRESMACD